MIRSTRRAVRETHSKAKLVLGQCLACGELLYCWRTTSRGPENFARAHCARCGRKLTRTRWRGSRSEDGREVSRVPPEFRKAA